MHSACQEVCCQPTHPSTCLGSRDGRAVEEGSHSGMKWSQVPSPRCQGKGWEPPDLTPGWTLSTSLPGGGLQDTWEPRGRGREALQANRPLSKQALTPAGGWHRRGLAGRQIVWVRMCEQVRLSLGPWLGRRGADRPDRDASVLPASRRLPSSQTRSSRTGASHGVGKQAGRARAHVRPGHTPREWQCGPDASSGQPCSWLKGFTR